MDAAAAAAAKATVAAGAACAASAASAASVASAAGAASAAVSGRIQNNRETHAATEVAVATDAADRLVIAKSGIGSGDIAAVDKQGPAHASPAATAIGTLGASIREREIIQRHRAAFNKEQPLGIAPIELEVVAIEGEFHILINQGQLAGDCNIRCEVDNICLTIGFGVGERGD